MADEPAATLVETLSARRTQIAIELEAVTTEIAEVTRELSDRITRARARQKPLEETLSHLDALITWEGRGAPEEVGRSRLDASNGRSPIEAAHQFLSQSGRPLHYREISQRLITDGVFLAGKDPAATLLTKMSRDDRFKRAPNRGVYG